jgi:hypothetical protein
MEDSDRNTDSSEDTTWEPNHPPRVMVSNTKIQLDREGILIQTCPKGENDWGCVFIQNGVDNHERDISCKTQESLEEANVFSPTRHLLLVIKRLWQIDRVHVLPAVVTTDFFPAGSN